MALIKCVDCGKEISDKAKQCPNCGCPVECCVQPQESEAAVEEAAVVNTDGGQNVKKNDGKKTGIIAVAILVVAALAVFAAYVMGLVPGASKTPEVTDEETTIEETTEETTEEETAADRISAISSRRVEYDAQNQCFNIFFGFLDYHDEYIDVENGSVVVDITNDDGTNVYSGIIYYDADDFSVWHNDSWSSDRYLACVKVYTNEIKEGAKNTGIFSLLVQADDISFDTYEINVGNLPAYEVETQHEHLFVDEICRTCNEKSADLLAAESKWGLSYPSLPITLHDDSSAVSIELTDLTYEFGYFGKERATLDITIVGEKTYDARGDESNTMGSFQWKLYDSAGVVHKTGYLFSPEISTGETFRDTVTILYGNDGDYHDSYRLEFVDVD